MKKRLVALLLVGVMLVPALVGCQETVDTTGSGFGVNDTTGEEETTSGMFQMDAIPDTIDYGGETVNLLCWEEHTMPEFEVESATGENVVEDALYYRNREVEQRLGVELNFIYTPGNASHMDEYLAKVEQAATGNTGEYDILASYSRSIANSVMGGYAYNLFEFDVLDFDAPWWSQDLIASTTVNGRLYYASGDISTNLIYMMNLTFFNTTMIADLGLDSPYDLVQNDEWFITKMFEMSEGLYEDVNANYSKDLNDKYGTVVCKVNIGAFFYGCGLSSTVIENGVPVFSDDYLGAPTRDFIVLMIENFKERNDCYYSSDLSIRDVFGRNCALFLVDSPFTVPKTIDKYVDCEYGIVPVPKKDEYQENYRSAMRYTYTLYTIFAGSPDPERAATVLECMASESYRQVTPAVFEITMKYQYALDDVAARMFDIIRDNIVYDIAREFDQHLADSPGDTYLSRIDNADRDWINFVSKSSKIMETSLARIVEKLEKLYGDK